MSNKKLIQPQTLKGFRDILPDMAIKRQWVKNIMVKTAQKWGYEPIETPTLESLSLFTGEIGEDEKLFFKFTDQGGRKVALRYDQTVPTCRFVGNNFDKLTFPFRRYQYQNVFRAEKPQAGRYREFTQFDLDIFGVASPLADAEVMAVNLDTYLAIGFKKPVIIFNNRDLMKDIPYPAIASIDKLKKIGKEKVIEEIISKSFSRTEATMYLNQLLNIKPDKTIKTIIDYLKNSGFSEKYYRFEPTLARSFSYSQGPIWEIVIEEYSVGSVGGGERYDKMMRRITGRDIPATGIAYGFDRTVEAADQLGLIPAVSNDIRALMTIFSPQLLQPALTVAKKLRQNEIKLEVYPDETTKIDKQLQYADKKNIPYVLIIGPDEAVKNLVTLKNMTTGKQETLTLEKAINVLTA